MSDRAQVSPRLLWLEITKAVALVLIVFNHALERMGEYPFVANPAAEWVPLADRVAQLEPTTGSLWDVAFNAIRYPGLLGEVGVQLFIIASGLGLTLSAIRRRGTGASFLRRRIERIAPTWLVVHLLALLASIPVLLFIGGGASDLVAAPWDARFWASLLGFRITPETIYYLVPSWWFIALLVQLYLVFPLLYRWFVRLGTGGFWYVVAGGVAIKLAGLLVLDAYLDVWSRGAFFVTRLPEFAFGMIIAGWLAAEQSPLRRNSALAVSVAATPLGIVSSLYLIGNAWGPFIYGAGLFVVLYRGLANRTFGGRLAESAVWVGRHSLALFIVHQPVFFILMPGAVAGPVRVIGGFVVAAGVTVAGAMILELVVERTMGIFRSWSERGVLRTRVVTVAVVVLVAYGGVVAADVWVKANDPQEVLGWGERPSLIADATLGWKLDPNRTTHLRWQSYDYEVTSNQYGFPGAAATPDPGDMKVLVLGDAFSSAEGVDTAQAWPRLLEHRSQQPTTVWNGAITGFGPLQYPTVARQLVPEFDPDVIVVGFFVNDFSDAEFDFEGMQESIGFDQPDPTGIVPSLRWGHISKYLRYNVTEPILSVAGLPNRTGYLLGQFDQFEPGAIDADREGYKVTAAAMAELAEIAPDARLVMMLIPASIQICEPGDLEYFPDNVALADFDLDQPQRLAAGLADEVGMEVLDLRPILGAATACPYQPGNMHWLLDGHEIVADAVAEYLAVS